MISAKLSLARSRMWLPALLLLAVPTAGAAEPLPVSAETAARIDEILAQSIEQKLMPGVAVTVASRDGGTFTRYLGQASLARAQSVTAATRFRLGSISKLVTAAAILKLAEEGRLGIAAPVASLLPENAAIAMLPASVTVERLLSHTSGLPDFTKEELEAKVARGVSTDGDLAKVLARPIKAMPGDQWAYADAPFRILSRIIERVSGLSYGAYVSKRLGPALGLSTLALCEPGAPEHAEGYLSEGGKLAPEPAYAIKGLLGEGGLCAAAEDLAKLPLSLADGRWLGASSVARMTAPTRLTDGTMVDYGLGVRGGLLGDQRAWGHTGGGLHGSWASVVYYPDAGVSVAVTANGNGSDVDAATLQGQLAAVVLDVKPPRNAPPSASLATAVAGAYNRGDQITCLLAADGVLIRTRPGATRPPTPLYLQADAVFARLDYPLDRIAFQIEGQTAVAYRVYYDGLFAELWQRSPDRAAACDSPLAADQ